MGGDAPRSSGPGGEYHSSPGYRYPARWKLNTLSKLCLLYVGAGGNAGGPASPCPGALFPAMCVGGWVSLFPLETSPFLTLGTANTRRPYFPDGIRQLQNHRSDSRLSGGLTREWTIHRHRALAGWPTLAPSKWPTLPPPSTRDSIVRTDYPR